MWYYPNTLTVFTTHHEIRAAFRQHYSLPDVLTDDVIASLGIVAVSDDPEPAVDLWHVAELSAPLQRDGTWVREWSIRELSEPELTALRTGMVVSMAQARKALILAGISIASIDAAIASIENGTTRALAATEWEYAGFVERMSPLVAMLAPLIGLTEEQVDQLFVTAKGI